MPARLIGAACLIARVQPDDTPLLHSMGGVLVGDSRVAGRRTFARAIFPHVRGFYDRYLAGVGNEPFHCGSGRASCISFPMAQKDIR